MAKRKQKYTQRNTNWPNQLEYLCINKEDYNLHKTVIISEKSANEVKLTQAEKEKKMKEYEQKTKKKESKRSKNKNYQNNRTDVKSKVNTEKHDNEEKLKQQDDKLIQKKSDKFPNDQKKYINNKNEQN